MSVILNNPYLQNIDCDHSKKLHFISVRFDFHEKLDCNSGVMDIIFSLYFELAKLTTLVLPE